MQGGSPIVGLSPERRPPRLLPAPAARPADAHLQCLKAVARPKSTLVQRAELGSAVATFCVFSLFKHRPSTQAFKQGEPFKPGGLGGPGVRLVLAGRLEQRIP